MKNLLAATTPLKPITGFSSGFSATSGLTGSTVASRLELIFSNIITVFTIFTGLASVIYFVIGAFTWITGGQEPGQLDKAKKQMTNSLTGIFLVILTVPVAWIIQKITGVQILNFAAIINILIPT